MSNKSIWLPNSRTDLSGGNVTGTINGMTLNIKEEW